MNDKQKEKYGGKHQKSGEWITHKHHRESPGSDHWKDMVDKEHHSNQ